MFTHCPKCFSALELVEINCGVFRCGIFKKSFESISPHATKGDIMEWLSQDLIYGCGTPLELIDGRLTICEYK
jgi:hypothetical protein